VGKKCLGDVADSAQPLLVAPEFDLLVRCPEVIARPPCLADDLNLQPVLRQRCANENWPLAQHQDGLFVGSSRSPFRGLRSNRPPRRRSRALFQHRSLLHRSRKPRAPRAGCVVRNLNARTEFLSGTPWPRTVRKNPGKNRMCECRKIKDLGELNSCA
jgi:hypothetical protein